jgi:hypothetical protein
MQPEKTHRIFPDGKQTTNKNVSRRLFGIREISMNIFLSIIGYHIRQLIVEAHLGIKKIHRSFGFIFNAIF